MLTYLAFYAKTSKVKPLRCCKIMENVLDARLLGPEMEDEGGLLRRVVEESKVVWRTAFPAIVFRLSVFGAQVVTQAFVGHTSQVELAAFALVQAITSRFATGILTGMSSATETLCGQAFGAEQYHMMGIYLQRSWIVDTATVIVILPLFIFAAPMFKLLRQEEDISDATEEISLWFIGVIYSFAFTLTTEMFLIAQRKNMFIGLSAPINFMFHILVSWIFVSKLGWGVTGAMAAFALTRWIFVFMLMIYVFGGWCPKTWTGFSKEALHDIVPIVKLSISSGVMLCVQMWYNSILVLLAGYTNNASVDISAFSICLNINQWQYMICLGLMGATSARVSNNLGNGDHKAAKFSIELMLSTSMVLGLFFGVIVLVFGHKVPYYFTNDDEVAKTAAKLFYLLAITVSLNTIQAVLSGIAIGTGSQAKVAFVNIGTYYVIGIPIGCVLTYVLDYGIKGIWIGLLSGLAMQVLVLAYLTWRIDWTAEVDKATQRLNRFYLDQS